MKKYATEFVGIFWLAPIVGAIIGAQIYKFIASDKE